MNLTKERWNLHVSFKQLKIENRRFIERLSEVEEIVYDETRNADVKLRKIEEVFHSPYTGVNKIIWLPTPPKGEWAGFGSVVKYWNVRLSRVWGDVQSVVDSKKKLSAEEKLRQIEDALRKQNDQLT